MTKDKYKLNHLVESEQINYSECPYCKGEIGYMAKPIYQVDLQATMDELKLAKNQKKYHCHCYDDECEECTNWHCSSHEDYEGDDDDECEANELDMFEGVSINVCSDCKRVYFVKREIVEGKRMFTYFLEHNITEKDNG